MIKLHFSIQIKALKEKVWEALWDDINYRKWTSVFTEGSYAVSDWEEGGKVLFLSPGGSGMFSIIDKKIPFRFMSFKHLGTVKDGVEQPETEETKKWSGAMENYTLDEKDGTTELSVAIDVSENEAAYFKETLPKALNSVKTIAEY